jgi:uncharacterized protein (TIGR04222 family)
MIKGRFSIRLLTIALLACLPATLLVADERILEYRSDVVIHENGELTITETLRVRSEGKVIRRGITREFPTRYKDRLGNRVVVDFAPVSVRRNSQPEAWHLRDRSNGVALFTGRTDRLLEPGIHDYELVFNTNRQLGFFDEHDELYYNAISHGNRFTVDAATVTVTLPFDLECEKLDLSAFTGQVGSTESSAAIDFQGGRTATFESSRPLAPGEGMTVLVEWPKGLIDSPGWKQKLRWFLADNSAALILGLGWIGAFLLYGWAWTRVGRDPDRGVIIPRFEPPEGLSPAASRYVLDMTFNRHAFTAAVISLAVKGHLTIEEEDEKFTLTRRTGSKTEKTTAGEQAVLDALLPATGSSITLDNEEHEKFQSAMKHLKQALKKEHLGRLFHLNGRYAIAPVVISVAAAVVPVFFQAGPAVWIAYAVMTLALHGLLIYLLRAPTVSGRLVMDEIEGFRMYLATAERDRLDQMRSPRLTPEVFESFLPYAYALGVQNKWCSRFEAEMPEGDSGSREYRPVWYSGQMGRSNSLAHLGSGFGKSLTGAIASASTPPGSASGSGGGGYSGGGGGGGGVGGW